MELGTFSMSLKVEDLQKSLHFYEAMGFQVTDGGHINKEYPDTKTSKWRILEHPSVIIGLFQGVLDVNILTFHPEDVRTCQKKLKAEGIDLMQEADESTTGPASCMFTDPDGNLLMFDQF